MGIADFWIKLTKEIKDEDWPIDNLWFELTNRRKDEKTISYVESHDQALVGDQTIIFRMIGKNMYDHMCINDKNLQVARGIALHKLVRLITLSTAGQGYLNFMGNEFGHPEWIDFPRKGNNWSYKYAKRQWHLVEDTKLKYHLLGCFDKDMIIFAKKYQIFDSQLINLLHLNSSDKVIIFERAGLIFVFNFHPSYSYTNYQVNSPPGKYKMVLNSDLPKYGGYNRLAKEHEYFTIIQDSHGGREHKLCLYLPSRCAFVLSKK
jgi:1,4-alpha-glucan branching enzyme